MDPGDHGTQPGRLETAPDWLAIPVPAYRLLSWKPPTGWTMVGRHRDDIAATDVIREQRLIGGKRKSVCQTLFPDHLSRGNQDLGWVSSSDTRPKISRCYWSLFCPGFPSPPLCPGTLFPSQDTHLGIHRSMQERILGRARHTFLCSSQLSVREVSSLASAPSFTARASITAPIIAAQLPTAARRRSDAFRPGAVSLNFATWSRTT
jgi:hypothetical protein